MRVSLVHEEGQILEKSRLFKVTKEGKKKKKIGVFELVSLCSTHFVLVSQQSTLTRA